MSDERLPVRLGINIDPHAGKGADAFARAQVADEHGIDLLTVMDHPYLPDLHEAWTLITALLVRTERVHVAPNVLNTPLRPPAMLAKAALTLDRLSGGRFELGVGAGGYVEAANDFGASAGTPAERYAAFRDWLAIARGVLDGAGDTFSHAGTAYSVRDIKPGPAPTERIPIWTGALGPQMLRLTGRVADGLLISHGYVMPERLPEFNRLLDEGAAQAGRPPSAIRRGYNLMGVLNLGVPSTAVRPTRQGAIVGDARAWADAIERFARDFRQDTFIFWPIAGDELLQIEAFASEVAPDVRERLAK